MTRLRDCVLRIPCNLDVLGAHTDMLGAHTAASFDVPELPQTPCLLHSLTSNTRKYNYICKHFPNTLSLVLVNAGVFVRKCKVLRFFSSLRWAGAAPVQPLQLASPAPRPV